MLRRWVWIAHNKSNAYRSERLTSEVKLTDFGAASPAVGLSRDDERSAALATRAQKGDYDDGMDTSPF
jgi:hypothetical protein